MATYEREATGQTPPSSFRVAERHLYGSSRLGIDATPHEFIGTTYTASPEAARTLGHKHYEISNHLGNVLSVITDQKLPVVDLGTVVSYAAVVLSATDYSPFGVGLYGRSWSEGYRFGFQGQEKDDELKGRGNSLNYKYRMHDPRIGRFFAVDPLAVDYPYNSPYAFSENDLIRAVELEGLEKKVTIDNSAAPGGDIKTQHVGCAACIKEQTDVTKDKYFGPVLDQLNAEGLINAQSTVTFTWLGQRDETKTTGPWYWRSTNTYLYLTYNLSFTYEGADISVPIEVGLGSIVYHPGSNAGDYALALVGSGAYAMAFKSTVVNNAKKQVISHYTKVLQDQGVKIVTGEALNIGKDLAGKIVWLAQGSERGGLKHILSRHTDDFVNQGIAKQDIGEFVFDAVQNGKVVGSQGTGSNARTIYETIYKGETKRVAATVSENGYIVGANPVSIK